MNYKDIEKDIIFETIAGSHCYGLATPESDLDIRGVFIVPDKKYYIGCSNVEQVAGDGDTEIYELKKFIKLATDCNPGTSWNESMQFAIALACRYMGLTPAQAIAAATINAAHAIRRADTVGSIEVGKLADLTVLGENPLAVPPERIKDVPVAEVIGLSKQAEEQRAILKYKAVINWPKVGEEQVWALIEVNVTPEPEVGFDSVAGRIALFPHVRSAYLASGTYDLLLVVVGKTEHEIADFVAQKLAHIQGVKGTNTHFVLKRYKEDGEILDSGETVKRQMVVL